MKTVLTNENTFTVSHIGSALEADKKINLALKISVIVHASEAARPTAQRRSANVRGDGIYPTSGVSMARPACHLWTVEFGLYPVAALVCGWAVGQIVKRAGTQRARQIEVFGCQPYQGASGCEQSCWRPAKSSHWTHQGWVEHQAECLGGGLRPRGQFELGTRAAGRCHRRPSGCVARVARHDYRGRQRLRQRRLSCRVAASWQSPVHSAALQSARASQLAARSLPKAAQGRELIPALEALPQNRDTV